MISSVFITVGDLLSPIIKGPGKIFFNEGETGNSITWQVYDQNPGEYYIMENGIRVINGTWGPQISDQISVNIDILPWGFYNISLVVLDFYNNTVVDSLHVTVYAALEYNYPSGNYSTSQTTVDNMFDNIDPTYVAGAGGVLMLIGAGYIFTRRR